MPDRVHTLPDGRVVHSVYEGEPVGWVVWFANRQDAPVAARDIHDALVDLVSPGDGQWPSWFIEAANELAASNTPDGPRYPCPCCGTLALAEPPTGTYEICRTCGWEDDPVQFHDLDYRGGATLRASAKPARTTPSADLPPLPMGRRPGRDPSYRVATRPDRRTFALRQTQKRASLA
jgi:hypothetical protein